MNVVLVRTKVHRVKNITNWMMGQQLKVCSRIRFTVNVFGNKKMYFFLRVLGGDVAPIDRTITMAT